MGVKNAVGPSPIQSVLLVTRFDRREKALRFDAHSLPGHLIQLVTAGKVYQECNGRGYILRPGCALWYHEDETVRGTVIESPWIYYSVNFIAPSLPPPEFESRLLLARPVVHDQFKRLFQIWNDSRLPPTTRTLRVHAALSEMIANLTTPSQQRMRMDPRAQLWWRLETELRRRLDQPIHMKQMEEIAGHPRAVIAASCQHAVGMPPMKRIKQVRMSLARSLVRGSDLTITEIAGRVGYARIHEFSRDYHKHFSTSPKHDSRMDWAHWAVQFKPWRDATTTRRTRETNSRRQERWRYQ
jgi:AraC-like DNA-binding protein